MDPRSLSRALGRRLGGAWRTRPLGASGFCATWHAERSGEALFVKTLPTAQADVLEAEADGLAALEASATIAVPRVRACWRDADAGGALLAMEWLALVPADAGFGGRFGEALGRLHRATPPAGGARFGWHRDNFLGATPQRNHPPEADGVAGWIAFLRDERLGALRDRLMRLHGATVQPLADAIDAVIDALPHCFSDGHVPQPRLLHGDLWSGNWGQRSDGRPVIFDPAVSRGDPEAELAMMELFGAPPQGFWPAYRATAGLPDGYPRRRPVYQLYHLLNHALLFGGGYGDRSHALARRIAEDARR